MQHWNEIELNIPLINDQSQHEIGLESFNKNGQGYFNIDEMVGQITIYFEKKKKTKTKNIIWKTVYIVNVIWTKENVTIFIVVFT